MTGGLVGDGAPRTDRRSQTGVRARLRATPGGRQLLQVVVFVVGLAFILLGGVAVVLPGPLTIPPILVGLYVWSTEFAWADRLLLRARASAREAWQQARARPVLSSVVTFGGLAVVGLAIFLLGRYDLIARARDAVGL